MNSETILHKISKDLGMLQTEARVIRTEVTQIRRKQDDLIAQANRWKGGIIMILLMGALISWVGDILQSVISAL